MATFDLQPTATVGAREHPSAHTRWIENGRSLQSRRPTFGFLDLLCLSTFATNICPIESELFLSHISTLAQICYCCENEELTSVIRGQTDRI